MSTGNENEQSNNTEKKKLSLQEAIKQKLADKKKQTAENKGIKNSYSTTAKHMKSQQTKKANNQRRRTGV